MNKKNTIILFLIIILFLALSFFLFLIYKNKTIETTIEKRPTVEFKGKDIPSITPIVLFTDDCQELTDENKEKCLNEATRNEANIANNFRMCLKITDYALRNKCIFEMAKFTTKENCERIADHHLAEVCIGDIGINNRDVNFCNIFIEEPHEYEECVDRIKAFSIGDTGNIDECTNIKTLEYSNLCMSRSLGNGATCNDLSDIYLMEKCISFVIFNQTTPQNSADGF